MKGNGCWQAKGVGVPSLRRNASLREGGLRVGGGSWFVCESAWWGAGPRASAGRVDSAPLEPRGLQQLTAKERAHKAGRWVRGRRHACYRADRQRCEGL